MLKLKEQIETTLYRDAQGFLIISQGENKVCLSSPQVDVLVKWLKEGNGFNLESDWSDGTYPATGE